MDSYWNPQNHNINNYVLIKIIQGKNQYSNIIINESINVRDKLINSAVSSCGVRRCVTIGTKEKSDWLEGSLVWRWLERMRERIWWRHGFRLSSSSFGVQNVNLISSFCLRKHDLCRPLLITSPQIVFVCCSLRHECIYDVMPLSGRGGHSEPVFVQVGWR